MSTPQLTPGERTPAPESPDEMMLYEHEPTELELARMSFFEHLAELRKRLLYSIVALFVGFVACWTVAKDIYKLLLWPLQQGLDPAKYATIAMHHRDLAEPVFTLMKAAILGGVFVAAPVVMYQLWKFVGPALYPREQRMVVPFVLLGTLFFFAGAAFCFTVVIPFGYRYLVEFSEDISSPMLMISDYFALTTKLLLGFGLIFEMPVAAMFLSRVGVITHRHLLKHWRIAVVGAFVIGAILTPPDVITQCLMAIPLLILYFLSAGVAYVFTKQREAREQAMLQELEQED